MLFPDLTFWNLAGHSMQYLPFSGLWHVLAPVLTFMEKLLHVLRRDRRTFIMFSLFASRGKYLFTLQEDDGGESLREIILSFHLSVLKVPELMRPDGKSTYLSKFFLLIKNHDFMLPEAVFIVRHVYNVH
ncbi:uncharacterized protein LOC130693559 [Daphnia carinata]|uniref:uncharacterized protein LOC130693559 n=1 Tax=Daphnia carinata TaxID=120202 RepID=UPI00257A5ECB|nr:uncharacterized protein LOC130693559 [Daphnia carinata]